MNESFKENLTKFKINRLLQISENYAGACEFARLMFFLLIFLIVNNFLGYIWAPIGGFLLSSFAAFYYRGQKKQEIENFEAFLFK